MYKWTAHYSDQNKRKNGGVNNVILYFLLPAQCECAQGSPRKNVIERRQKP